MRPTPWVDFVHWSWLAGIDRAVVIEAASSFNQAKYVAETYEYLDGLVELGNLAILAKTDELGKLPRH